MPILPFINLKGGVAKTTNAVAVAECLAAQGRRVLVIDADHQCMAGELLLGEPRLLNCEKRKTTLHDMLAAMLDPEFTSDEIPAYVVKGASDIGGGIANLSVMPCSIRIDDFATNMAKARHGYKSTDEFLAIYQRRRRQIRAWLTENFDFTIIDCPPSIPVQVKVFLPIADGLIIPSIPDRLSVRGSLYLLDRLRRMNIGAKPLGTLWSLYREQNAMHKKYVQAAEQGLAPFDELPRPFEAVIPNAAAIAEATELQRRPPTSFSAKYKSPFSKLFQQLSNEIESRSDWSPRTGKNGALATVK